MIQYISPRKRSGTLPISSLSPWNFISSIYYSGSISLVPRPSNARARTSPETWKWKMCFDTDSVVPRPLSGTRLVPRTPLYLTQCIALSEPDWTSSRSGLANKAAAKPSSTGISQNSRANGESRAHAHGEWLRYINSGLALLQSGLQLKLRVFDRGRRGCDKQDYVRKTRYQFSSRNMTRYFSRYAVLLYFCLSVFSVSVILTRFRIPMCVNTNNWVSRITGLDSPKRHKMPFSV